MTAMWGAAGEQEQFSIWPPGGQENATRDKDTPGMWNRIIERETHWLPLPMWWGGGGIWRAALARLDAPSARPPSYRFDMKKMPPGDSSWGADTGSAVSGGRDAAKPPDNCSSRRWATRVSCSQRLGGAAHSGQLRWGHIPYSITCVCGTKKVRENSCLIAYGCDSGSYSNSSEFEIYQNLLLRRRKIFTVHISDTLYHT